MGVHENRETTQRPPGRRKVDKHTLVGCPPIEMHTHLFLVGETGCGRGLGTWNKPDAIRITRLLPPLLFYIVLFNIVLGIQLAGIVQDSQIPTCDRSHSIQLSPLQRY